MTALNMVVDAMLPGDSVLGMPSASTIDFETYLMQHNLNQLSSDFIQILDKICEEKKGMSFVDLDEVEKMQAINACKLVDVRVFSAMVGHLFKAYYTAPCVLMKIKSGSVPPFPNGNSIEQDDWSILEPVYERGQVFREAL